MFRTVLPRKSPAVAAALLLVPAAALAQCSITGPATFCPSGAQICATGGQEFQWTGPNGFTATTACIDVTVAGTYSVRVFDNENGIWWGPCVRTMAPGPDAECGGGGSVGSNCPRTARFWWRSCGGSSGLEPAQFAKVAAAVDARAAGFVWSDPVAGFCATLRPSHRSSLRARARRQVASLFANLCARDEGLVTGRGRVIGLDGATAFTPEQGSPTTIAAWAASADQQIVALEGASLRERATRDAYRAVIRTAWALNHGRGMGPICLVGDQELLPDADVVARELSMELADEEVGGVALERPSPNPFGRSTRFALEVTDPAGASVEVAVVDIAGRVVRQLARGRMAAGRHELQWDGMDANGAAARVGVYFVQGRVGGERFSTSVMLAR